MVSVVANAIWALIGFAMGIVSAVNYYERRRRQEAEGRAAACRLCEVTQRRHK